MNQPVLKEGEPRPSLIQRADIVEVVMVSVVHIFRSIRYMSSVYQAPKSALLIQSDHGEPFSCRLFLII